MGNKLTAAFEVTKWDEKEFDERPGAAKLTRASVVKSYTGDITGTSMTEWLMAYAEDGSASFVGLERIEGTFGGKQGTLVLEHIGTYADGAAKAELNVVAKPGSGEFANVSGTGDFLANPQGTVHLTLTFP